MCIHLVQLYQGDAKSLEYFIKQISQRWIELLQICGFK